MTGLERKYFIDFMKDSISDNKYKYKYECELRLSTIEKAILMETYPSAIVTKMTANNSSDKHWFKVKLNKSIKK